MLQHKPDLNIVRIVAVLFVVLPVLLILTFIVLSIGIFSPQALITVAVTVFLLLIVWGFSGGETRSRYLLIALTVLVNSAVLYNLYTDDFFQSAERVFIVFLACCTSVLIFSIRTDEFFRQMIHVYLFLLPLPGVVLVFDPRPEAISGVMFCTVGIAICFCIFVLFNRLPAWMCSTIGAFIMLGILISVFGSATNTLMNSIFQYNLMAILFQSNLSVSLAYLYLVMAVVFTFFLVPRDLNWSMYWFPMMPPPRPED